MGQVPIWLGARFDRHSGLRVALHHRDCPKRIVTPDVFGGYPAKTSTFPSGGRGPAARGSRWRYTGSNALHCNWAPASAGKSGGIWLKGMTAGVFRGPRCGQGKDRSLLLFPLGTVDPGTSPG